MVSAVPKEEPLTVQVVRGTDVLEKHEQAIIDLCSVSESNDKAVEDCVVDFLSNGYYEDIGSTTSRSSTNGTSNDKKTTEDGDDKVEDGTDGMIDEMINLWVEHDDLPLPPTTSGIVDSTNGQQSKNKKPKPWSSRSSPSGTYVRDPKTGQMRNID